MELKINDKVKLKGYSGGWLIGTVVSFTHNGNVAVILPDEPALRNWYPTGYKLGSVHWDSNITKIEG